MKFDETLLAETQATGAEAITGTLDGLDEDGGVYFRRDGQEDSERVILGLAATDEEVIGWALENKRAVALRTGKDSAALVLVGLLREGVNISKPELPEEEVADVEMGQPESVLIDGKRICFEAREEIVLRCGKGSITLRKDGKIVIRGTHLLSRAAGVNRIKGGQVNIN